MRHTDDRSWASPHLIAASIGCDLERYRRDLPQAEARIAAEMKEARAAGVHSLPTLFIGHDQIVGAGKSAEELTALLEQAAAAQ